MTEQLPKIVRERLKAELNSNAHPDANLLSAFAEASLSTQERARVSEHLARCSECREVVFLATSGVGTSAAAATPEGYAWFRAASFRVARRSISMPRWALAAACVLVVGSAVLLRYPRHAAKLVGRSDFGSAVAVQTVPPESPAISASKLPVPSEIQRENKNSRSVWPQLRKEQVAQGESAAPTLAMKKAPPMIAEFSKGRQTELLVPKSSEMVKVLPDEKTAATNGAPNQDEISAGPPAPVVGGVIGGIPPAPNRAVMPRAAPKPPNNAAGAAPENVPQSGSANERTAAQAAPQVSETVTVEAESPRAESDMATVGAKARILNVPRWSLSSDGHLLHSFDRGQTWQQVPVAVATFRAVSSLGSEVWVGGNGGALYHSSDAGMHWRQVKPVAANTPLTSDIVRLDFTDAQHGELSTASHQTWVTGDGGHTWQIRQANSQ